MAKKIKEEPAKGGVETKASDVLTPSAEEVVVKKLNKKTVEKKPVAKKGPVTQRKDLPKVDGDLPVDKAGSNSDKKMVEGEKTKKSERGFYFGNGRRKTATARARLHLPTQEILVNGKKLEKGDVYVNGTQIDKYFNDANAKAMYSEVFRTTNTMNRFITTVHVSGSGKTGQLGATVLAIARALVTVDPKFKTTLRKKGFMTRDPRMKERKKPGLMGARKQKSSPKR